jgi:hypothetical protein
MSKQIKKQNNFLKHTLWYIQNYKSVFAHLLFRDFTPSVFYFFMILKLCAFTLLNKIACFRMNKQAKKSVCKQEQTQTKS